MKSDEDIARINKNAISQRDVCHFWPTGNLAQQQSKIAIIVANNRSFKKEVIITAYMKNLPVGLQNFKDLIEGDYVYVDKTQWIHELVKYRKGLYFLSRPRRFGKSLLISTLYYLFKGEKELFKDLYIYGKYDFEEYPIIRMDMSKVDTISFEMIQESIKLSILRPIAQEHSIEIKESSVKVEFDQLINEMSRKYKKEVVILIDEYDKPILDKLGDLEEANRVRETLRGFYGVLKSNEEKIRFLFVTGISKFSKVSIFSELNNLEDLTLNPRYSEFLGYTEEEIKRYFHKHIEETAKEMGMEEGEFLQEMRQWYDGYSFDGKKKVYNPYSILNLLKQREFKNYWFESGSPMFILEYAKRKGISLKDITNKLVSLDFLDRKPIELATPESMLFQAGYLTIKERLERAYVLDFPNKEVRSSFSELLLVEDYKIEEGKAFELMYSIYTGFRKGNISEVIEAMNRLLSAIPYQLHMKREKYYHSLLLTALYSTGLEVEAEESTSGGRSDIVVKTKDKVYVIELKMDRPAREAIEQVKERGYAQKYKDAKIVAISIDSKQKKITEWVEV